MVTIRDVSSKAGVSVATVSRVLNDKKVAKETFDRVQKAMVELNYQPNQIARSLSNKQTKTIALIIPAINNPFFPALANSIENIAYEHGYKVYFFNTNDNREKLVDYIDSINSHYVDGVIINSHMLTVNDLNKLKEKNVPIVEIDRSNHGGGFTSVSVNNKLGGQLATKHLLEVGCKRIGHLRGVDNEVNTIQRLWGYRSIVSRLDWFDQSWIASGNYSVEGGYQGMKELLIRHPDIDGVFAANDLTAIGAIKAAYEWKRKIPDELCIVGFDGIDMSKYMVPSITTIAQPIYQMGEIAIKELIKLIENQELEVKNFELNIQLIQRESTLR